PEPEHDDAVLPALLPCRGPAVWPHGLRACIGEVWSGIARARGAVAAAARRRADRGRAAGVDARECGTRRQHAPHDKSAPADAPAGTRTGETRATQAGSTEAGSTARNAEGGGAASRTAAADGARNRRRRSRTNDS